MNTDNRFYLDSAIASCIKLLLTSLHFSINVRSYYNRSASKVGVSVIY